MTERLKDLRAETLELHADLKRLVENVSRIAGRLDGIDQRFTEVDKRIELAVKLAVRDEFDLRSSQPAGRTAEEANRLALVCAGQDNCDRDPDRRTKRRSISAVSAASIICRIRVRSSGGKLHVAERAREKETARRLQPLADTLVIGGGHVPLADIRLSETDGTYNTRQYASWPCLSRLSTSELRTGLPASMSRKQFGVFSREMIMRVSRLRKKSRYRAICRAPTRNSRSGCRECLTDTAFCVDFGGFWRRCADSGQSPGVTTPRFPPALATEPDCKPWP